MPTAQRRRLLLQSAAFTVAGVCLPTAWAAGKIKPGERAALIVVDVQNCFVPGGTLPVAQGDEVVPVINRIATAFENVVVTQDWHTQGHASFASAHGGKKPFDSVKLNYGDQVLWPDHCVQGSPGAALHPGVDWAVADLILRKGTRQQVDSYSAFRENHGPDGTRPATGLAGWLHERGIREVHVCGLARDYCVLWSAQDAVKSGFRVKFLWELTRPVTEANDVMVRDALAKARIAIL